MHKSVWLFIGIVFWCTSCATQVDQRERFVITHPEVSERVREAVLRGSVFEGMGIDAVRASWGKPQRTYTKIFGSVPALHWEYDLEQPDRIDTYILIFRNNKVIKMQLSHTKTKMREIREPEYQDIRESGN